MTIDFNAALQHAGSLQRVLSLHELVAAAAAGVRAKTRYQHAWLVLLEEDATRARLLEFSGPSSSLVDLAFATCPVFPVVGDEMMMTIVSGRAPVIVEDARTDPRTNKAIVARLHNRTIVNIPIMLGPEVLGSLGVGTYGDEGVLVPTTAEVEWLTVMGMQLGAAYTRLRLLEQQRESDVARGRLERHLETLQRIEVRGVLASGVAHDLNNFLSVIQANVELLAEGAEPAGELLQDVGLATAKAREVVQQLLALGRSQAPRRERVDLNAHLASTVHLVRSSLPRGVQVQQSPGSSPPVRGDPVQVDQVLANLLINARDAVGVQGQIEVGVDERVISQAFVADHPWAREGRFGHIWVRDDGCGIASENLARIFDPLFTTKSRGTGLGLAVVARVVASHEGLIHCDSVPGRGTTFDVYLPAGADQP